MASKKRKPFTEKRNRVVTYIPDSLKEDLRREIKGTPYTLSDYIFKILLERNA